MIKQFLKHTPFYTFGNLIAFKINSYKQIRIWKKNHKPLPPPQAYKHSVIKSFAKQFQITVFVETGTFYGDTIQACKHYFKKIFSIELNEQFYLRAKDRFKKESKIKLLHGDSGEIIVDILRNLTEPAIFWLDGHFSGNDTAKGILNTPILNELTHILNHDIKNHIILIDDARCFNGSDDYPTIKSLTEFISRYNTTQKITVENDIVRIY